MLKTKDLKIEDLALSMKHNMTPKILSFKDKISLAFQHLNDAAELFDSSENYKDAQEITNILTTCSSNIVRKFSK